MNEPARCRLTNLKQQLRQPQGGDVHHAQSLNAGLRRKAGFGF
jgi:hypothetical protein